MQQQLDKMGVGPAKQQQATAALPEPPKAMDEDVERAILRERRHEAVRKAEKAKASEYVNSEEFAEEMEKLKEAADKGVKYVPKQESCGCF